MSIQRLQLHDNPQAVLRLPGSDPNSNARGAVCGCVPLSGVRNRVPHDHRPVHDDATTDPYSHATADEHNADARCNQSRHVAACAHVDQHAVSCHHEDDESGRLPRYPLPNPNLPDPLDTGYPMQLHAQDTALRSGMPDRMCWRMSHED